MAVPTWIVISSTLAFFALVVTVYYFLLRPVVYTPSTDGGLATCPAQWTYNLQTKMCEPAYATQCKPFDPTLPMFSTAATRCDIARSCGTEWAGIKCF